MDPAFTRMEKRSADCLSVPSVRLSVAPSEHERHTGHEEGWEDIPEDVMETDAVEGVKVTVQSPIAESPLVDRVQQAGYAPSRASKRSGSGLKQSRRRAARDQTPPSIHRSRTYREQPGDDRSERESIRERPKTTSDAWSRCNRALKDHDDPMVAGWKEDIDTLLVFAGLFSAVLTAFIVESYRFLQPDPDGTSTNILREILVELRNQSSPQSAASVDSQYPFITPNSPSFAIRVNTYWFCSLVFSLSAASVGILVKQWLRDYTSRAGTSSREAARIRQFRHNGLVKWHVPEIIAALPLLLQWALGLFFIGLIDLLWSLNFVVAGIVTVLACTSLAFLVVTTVLPAFWVDCPHRSPQALAFYLTYKASTRIVVWILVKVIGPLGLQHRPWPLYASEALFQGRWRRFKLWLVKLLHERRHGNWREREKHVVRSQEAARLDRQVLAGADALFMDDAILAAVITPCIAETAPDAAAECLLDILAHRADGMVDDLPSWKPSGALDAGVATQLRLTVDILRRSIPAADQERVMRMLRMLDRLCRAIPFELDHLDTKALYEQVYEVVSALLSFRQDDVRRSAFAVLYTLFPRANAFVRINTIVIENIIAFARAAKASGDGDTYFSACVMALQFGAELPRAELRASRAHLQRLLHELEQHITAARALPSPSLRAALYDVAQRDRGLVRPELLAALDQLAAARPAADDRALRNLRRLYSARRPVRQSAFLPVQRLEQLGLSLPELPQQAVEASGARAPSGAEKASLEPSVQ